MGILNVTPNSFSGDGVGDDVDAAVAARPRLVDAGADIIDIGGESTRPQRSAARRRRRGAGPRAARDPRARRRVDVPDEHRHAQGRGRRRRRSTRARSIVNDVWGLRGDPDMVDVVAAHPHGPRRHAQPARHRVRRPHGGHLRSGCAESSPSPRRRHRRRSSVIVDPGLRVRQDAGAEPRADAPPRASCADSAGRSWSARRASRPSAPPDRRRRPARPRRGHPRARDALGRAPGRSMVRVHDVAATVRALRVADAVVRGTPDAVRSAARSPDRPGEHSRDGHRRRVGGAGSNLGHRGQALARLRAALTDGGVSIEAASTRDPHPPVGRHRAGRLPQPGAAAAGPDPWSPQRWLDALPRRGAAPPGGATPTTGARASPTSTSSCSASDGDIHVHERGPAPCPTPSSSNRPFERAAARGGGFTPRRAAR